MSLSRIVGAYLAVVEPLFFAIEVQGALGRVIDFGVPAVLLLAARVAVAMLGIAAGLILWRGDEGGWRLARIWAIAAAMVLVATFATPYFPSNRTPFVKRLWLGGWLLAYLAAFLVAQVRARRDATHSRVE